MAARQAGCLDRVVSRLLVSLTVLRVLACLLNWLAGWLAGWGGLVAVASWCNVQVAVAVGATFR